MARKLTKKQKEFADEYLKTGNGSESAKKTYKITTDGSARAVASENLTKPNIKAYLEDKASRCAEIVYELAEKSKNDAVRLGACKDLMDRGGLKPQDKIDLTSKGEKIYDTKQIELIARRIANSNGNG